MNSLVWISLFAFLGAPVLQEPVDLKDLLATDPDAAAKQCQEILKMNSKDGMAHLILCEYFTDHEQDLAKAMKHGKMAVEHLPELSEAHFRYAVALRHKMSQNRMSAMTKVGTYQKSLSRAIELDPDHHEAYREKVGFLLNAPPIAGGSKKKARELAESQMEKDRTEGLISMSMVQAAEKDYLGALKTYEELGKLLPDQAIYPYQAGFALQGMERYQDAAATFDMNFAKHRHFPSLYQAARSRILGKFEQEQAIAILDRYIAEKPAKQNPSAAAAYWRKGMALEAINQKDKAREAYESSLKLEPDFKEAKESLAALK